MNMRREGRNGNKDNDDLSIKIIKYAGIAVAVLAVIVFCLLMYSKSLNDEVKQGSLSSEQIASIMNTPQTETNTQSTSTEMGKSVEESKNEVKEQNQTNTTNTIQNQTTNTTTQKSLTNKQEQNTTTNKENTTNKQTTNSAKETNAKTEEKKELQFEKPVEGDIVREFAKENLIFSETLQEWTTHTGVDMKADKTTVVKAAEAGTVKSIKNDPRYGLTIVLEHENGFQTIYANLLTSEFVVEGEKVEKGQSLGTVGNTAVFEIADEPHLHFEVIKDGTQVDPSIYLK